MKRRTFLLGGVLAPLLCSQSAYQLQYEQAQDLIRFKEVWDRWTEGLLRGINDLKAGQRVVKQWGCVRRWLP